MALKSFKPTTPSRRGTVLVDHKSQVTKKKPEKKLITGKIKYLAGRSKGKVTVRHRGGRVKRLFRFIDFKRNKLDIAAKVKAIEYDPNRTSYIALVVYRDGEKRYILAPEGIKVGDLIISSKNEVEIKVGNATKLNNLPSSIFVHNIELKPGEGGKLCRSAGSSAQVMGKVGKYVQLKMPSGEIRLVNGENFATIGELSNKDNSNEKLGKAGRKRKLGFRPSVRGVVMGAEDHPHGGGEAKHREGRPRKTVYGKRTFKKTRRKKLSDKLIIKTRKGLVKKVENVVK